MFVGILWTAEQIIHHLTAESCPWLICHQWWKKKRHCVFSWTVLLLLINCFLPQQACQDNHVKGLTLNLPIERTYEIFRNIIIYSTTIITYLPCWTAVFFISSKKDDMSDRTILWARSSQLHHMDLVLKTIYSTTVSVWMCFFLFRYSENWVV